MILAMAPQGNRCMLMVGCDQKNTTEIAANETDAVFGNIRLSGLLFSDRSIIVYSSLS